MSRCPQCAGYLSHIVLIDDKGYIVPKVACDEIERLNRELCFQRREMKALMRMMIRKATLQDRWHALRRKGHWLNCFRHEVLIP